MRLFSPLLEQAIEIASEWHDGTYRKSRWRAFSFEPPEEALLQIPVMAHLTTVALTVERAGWDDETVAAAFLHDILEDPNRFGERMTPERLAELMGEAVAERVRAVTEPKLAPGGQPLPWRQRKEAYLDRLRQASAESVAISLADKLHNLWTMNRALEQGLDLFEGSSTSPHGPIRALSAGPSEQRWFFAAVLAATEDFTDPRLAPMCTRLREELAEFTERTGDVP